MKLSNQAIGALLMTLQKCLAEEIDITELLADWDLEVKDEEVFVVNPPLVKASTEKPKFDVE
jgi:hypothetical protein